MFYDRIEDTAALFDHFAKGRNVLMLAPRRVGKTELLHHLREHGQEHGFRTVVFDVQGYRAEKDFFHELCSSIQEEMGNGRSVLTSLTQRLRQALKGTAAEADWRQLLLSTDWREFAHHLLTVLDDDAQSGKRWLIMVDELPIFIHELVKDGERDRASLFLHWLRNMRLKHRDIRWLYAGSIGLDAVARREDMEGALNDLELYPLKPFARPVAEGFVDTLSGDAGCTMMPEARALLLDRLGWLSPYYIEKLATAAFAAKDAQGRLDVSGVETAIESLLGLAYRSYWSTWREHLTKNFGDPERTQLFQVLKLIAVNGPDAVSRDTLLAHFGTGGEAYGAGHLARLLDTLEADGYIVAADRDRTRFRFLMNLLREWWLRYVVTEA